MSYSKHHGELFMTIGELLKEYRIKQDKSQRGFNKNIVSPSYYSKIEKNIHRITAEDLFNLLDQNEIPASEFVRKLKKSNQTDKKLMEIFLNRAVQLNYHTNTDKQYKDLLKEIQNSHLPDTKKEEVHLYVQGLYIKHRDDLTEDDQKIIQKIKDKLFSIPEFTLTKLQLYANFLPFYDTESNLAISKSIFKQYENSTDSNVLEAVLGIIINISSDLIDEKKFDQVEPLLKISKKIPSKYSFYFTKSLIRFIEEEVNYHFDHKKQHLENCQVIIKNLALAGMTDFSKEVNDGLNKFLRQEHS